MLARSPYIPSKTLYALKLDTLRIEPQVVDWRPGFTATARVEAVWTVRRLNEVQISIGVLADTLISDAPIDEQYILDNFSTSNGGQPYARWDGAYMWAPNATLAEMNEYAATLDPFLNDIPAVPVGYDGWYELTK